MSEAEKLAAGVNEMFARLGRDMHAMLGRTRDEDWAYISALAGLTPDGNIAPPVIPDPTDKAA